MIRPAAIDLQAVTKHYATPAGSVRAVDGVTLAVEAGTSIAITGFSGSGKSTLLGLIAGLETPTSGRVTIGGEELSRLSERARARLRRRRLGLVFQSDNLQPYLSAQENVGLQLALCGTGDGYERCLELLVELGLGNEAGKLPDQLSGGQRQRVAIARALINRPAVIVADEPTGSLDADNSAAVVELLLAASTTLVVVTHDPEVAARMDRTVALRDGRLVAEQGCVSA
ncbi:ABC transporter ATP-binding protein [Solirubrobacter ginsenosidimutans]|uniref:ABC transporter ATP-binding protein n=1 Tax=Solirubrobacter ginsenosidimutans TaxID=490573 RepID=A0A9X3MV56_9ACTN|nr:ABC transporter ATP-binding protein [Solirubrobacter ginsenosidimutans]MDA0160448.1 ABC transporter ATP-binding protein [Solirubrobacter ginsenosidimutans]